MANNQTNVIIRDSEKNEMIVNTQAIIAIKPTYRGAKLSVLFDTGVWVDVIVPFSAWESLLRVEDTHETKPLPKDSCNAHQDNCTEARVQAFLETSFA